MFGCILKFEEYFGGSTRLTGRILRYKIMLLDKRRPTCAPKKICATQTGIQNIIIYRYFNPSSLVFDKKLPKLC